MRTAVSGLGRRADVDGLVQREEIVAPHGPRRTCASTEDVGMLRPHKMTRPGSNVGYDQPGDAERLDESKFRDVVQPRRSWSRAAV